MLNVVNDWCSKWKMQINPGKTKVVHFRPPSVVKSSFHFMCGDNDIDVIPEYKYLGLILNEHMDYNVMAKAVAAAANRALGLLIAKSKAYGGMPVLCFTKLYNALVGSIIDYGAAIWGTREFSCISSVQHRACRFYLGLGRYAPNAAVQGDMGWPSPSQRQWLCVVRHWCNMINMDSARLTKKVFRWAHNQALAGNKKNWVYLVNKYMCDINLQEITNVHSTLNVKQTVNNVKMKLNEIHEIKWLEKINREEAVRGTGRNKLRTYRLFKKELKTEAYVNIIMPKRHRSALAKFRAGVAPLRIETGRYERTIVPINQRTCFNCLNNIEDEFHVIMKCPIYNELRQELLSQVDEDLIPADMNENYDRPSWILKKPSGCEVYTQWILLLDDMN